MIRRLTGRASVMLGLSLVSTITATVVVPRGPVAADQVSDLKTQATQIAKDLVLEQLQIGTYQQQYAVDDAKLQQDRAEIESTQNQIQAATDRVSRDRKRLESEAVSAYINLDPQVNGSQSLFESAKDAPTRAEYEAVASGDITLTIDALHLDENRLRSQRATLEQQEAQDQATTNQEATLADAAHRTEAQLESKPSPAGITARCRRGAPTWAGSNSASRRGTRRPSSPGCRNSSTSRRTRRLRPSRTPSPSRSTRLTASSPGTTPVSGTNSRRDVSPTAPRG